MSTHEKINWSQETIDRLSVYPIPLDKTRKAFLLLDENDLKPSDINRIRLWLDFYEAGLFEEKMELIAL